MKENIPWSKIDKNIIKCINKYINYIDGNVLDVGSGFGFLYFYFAKFNINYLGIEKSFLSVKESIELTKGKGNFINSDILTYIILDKYSLILDIGCLHLIDQLNHELIILKYLDGLKKNGFLIIRFFVNENRGILFYFNRIPVYGVSKNKIIELLQFRGTILEISYENEYDITTRVTIVYKNN